MRTIIIDDDQLSRRSLKLMLASHCPEIDVIAECNNASEASAMVAHIHPDVCFVDVIMPGKNGIDFIRDLKQENMQVIFVTAHERYAIQALRLSVADYLLKPIDPIRLTAAVLKVKNRLTRRSM